MRLSARIATLELAETFRIARERAGHRGRRPRRDRARRRRPATARRRRSSTTSESADSALAWLEAQAEALGDDPWALDEIERGCLPDEHAARAALDAALHDLRASRPALPVWRLLGLRRDRPADVVDDLARRPGRHGATRTEARRGQVPAAEAQARRRATGSTSSACARCGASPTLPLQVDVNEYWSLDEALERCPSSDARRRVLRAAAARRRPRTGRS